MDANEREYGSIADVRATERVWRERITTMAFWDRTNVPRPEAGRPTSLLVASIRAHSQLPSRVLFAMSASSAESGRSASEARRRSAWSSGSVAVSAFGTATQ